MYLNKIPIKNIHSEIGINRNDIKKLIMRCLQLDKYGFYLGYTALIPYNNNKKYTRKTSSYTNYSGVFTKLLNDNTELKKFIDETYLNKKKYSLYKSISKIEMYEKFIQKCYQLNIKEDEYPFNTLNKGKRSLYRYLDSLKEVHYSSYTKQFEEQIQLDIFLPRLKIKRKVNGNLNFGIRPHIYYEGVSYSNNILKNSLQLIETELTLLVDIEDLRTVKAYLPNGAEFGILIAKGKWSLQKHTIKMRREINKLKINKKIDFNMYDDPIDIYYKYLISIYESVR